MRYGIDVSENNGEIDWDDVRESGIDFAIVRCSYGQNGRDDNFLTNVNGAHAAGLQVGAYHYGYGLTPEQAVKEAVNCRSAIDEAGVLLELPVWYDMEDADGYKARHGFDFSADNCTNICREFLNHIRLNAGVYASRSWLDDFIDWRSLGCAVWNAEWMAGTNPEPDTTQDSIGGMMWQYTDKRLIAGRYFDGDIMY
jgi:GH25 family lysozyme M1 (1,4-beta-N-acetylmuramidase)